MPPPSAVIMPSVSTPTMSSRATRIAVRAPFSANANVPARSSTRKGADEVSTPSRVPARDGPLPAGEGDAARPPPRVLAEQRRQRNAILRDRDTHDYAFTDWIYGPTALTPDQEPAMNPSCRWSPRTSSPGSQCRGQARPSLERRATLVP